MKSWWCLCFNPLWCIGGLYTYFGLESQRSHTTTFSLSRLAYGLLRILLFLPGRSYRSAWGFVKAWQVSVHVGWPMALFAPSMSRFCRQAGHAWSDDGFLDTAHPDKFLLARCWIMGCLLYFLRLAETNKKLVCEYEYIYCIYIYIYKQLYHNYLQIDIGAWPLQEN